MIVDVLPIETDGRLDRVEHIMGMPIAIEIRDPDVDAAALDAAFDWFRWVDATFSTYQPDSEISRLNRGELILADAHPDVQSVLARCEELRVETDGYFDIHSNHLPVPLTAAGGTIMTTGIDPSGFVKGWSVDRAARILDAAGAGNYGINAGGDVVVRGGALPDAAWRVGIRHPFQRDQVAAVVTVSDLAVATSGAYERGEHIVNPHTGEPPSDVLSVSIVGPDLGTADAYATAIFAMGIDGPAWTTRLFGYEAMIILADRTVLSTRWFPKETAMGQ
ncbi:MAG TPA: FAD:protein FMN transferase [Chloroflexota bacterium]|nr:FAD:protein FMN transferase [Chloroflexota bacterium]